MAVTTLVFGSGRNSAGRNFAKGKAACKWHRDAGKRDGDRGAADPAHQLQIGLHTGQQQQHQDAELGNGIDHALLRAIHGKDRMLSRRPQHTEERRPKQQTADQLAHHRGLTDALRRFAHQAADQKQKRNFGDEERLRSEA
jgi:hypothetical protein